jgi:thiol-disulfide isomerase/thioredoxin
MKLIRIGAMWCSGCLLTNKNLKKLKEEYSDIEIVELDVDMDEEECLKYNYGDTLPVLIFEEDNKEIKRLVGEKEYKELKMVVESLRK